MTENTSLFGHSAASCCTQIKQIALQAVCTCTVQLFSSWVVDLRLEREKKRRKYHAKWKHQKLTPAAFSVSV